MSNLFLIPKILIKLSTLSFFCLALLLNGCQLLPFSSEVPPPPATQAIKMEEVATHTFNLTPSQTVVGNLASIPAHDNDTLSDIARHYGLGYNDITLANNGLDPWTLSKEQTVLLPLRFILPDTPHQGIVLNLANMRLFLYPAAETNTLHTYPVGIGRQGWNTPLGLTSIIDKKVHPDWTVPNSIKREHLKLGDTLPNVIHAGPDNPLGNYAMPLGFNSILIHGTNKPYGIGMQVSHGCIQLYPEDIEALFNQVSIGTPVRIVHQPYLAAWEDNKLYLEAHPPLEKWANNKKALQTELKTKLKKLAAQKKVLVDWHKVDEVLQKSDGVPTEVLANSTEFQQTLSLTHPEQLLHQPLVTPLSEFDWSLVTESFPNESGAQKLAAMLNHQHPQIPARAVFGQTGYQVVAGPFKNRQEAQVNAKRIKQVFEIDAQPLAPQKNPNCQTLNHCSTASLETQTIGE
jgi:L,D-transpeptidase ErfK/SrfK